MRVPAPGLTSRRVVERACYTTIMLMSVLVLYDGWENLKLIGVVAVIVGPVLAMVLAHVFAVSIAREVDLKKTPTNRERTRIVRDEFDSSCPGRAAGRDRGRLESLWSRSPTASRPCCGSG